MALIQWSQKFATGNSQVDGEHQELFRMVNSLHDAMRLGRGKDMIIPTLKGLALYVVKHFQHEEALMRQHNYVDYEEHRAFHQHLTNEVQIMLQQLDAGEDVLTLDLFRFLADWLKHHIEGSDQKMVAWILANSEVRPSQV